MMLKTGFSATRAAAIKRAKTIRTNKIKELEQEIVRLRSLKFE